MPVLVLVLTMAATVLTALSAASPAYAQAPLAENDTAYARPQQLIDIGGGRRINLYCFGTGTPTVIFDSGLSDWGFTWALVQPTVALQQRACVYDRAGLGYSDPSQRPATSANIVDDLHALLTAARIAPPYLLVGHSFGGMNVRLYADRYRNEVAGMVLLDPTHEDAIARIDAVRHGQESRRYRKQVSHWRTCLRRSARPLTEAFRRTCLEPADRRYSTALNAARDQVAARPAYQRAQLSEVENYANGVSFATARQARRNYGNLPLIVLTSGKTAAAAGVEWTRMHRELAALSSVGMQRTIGDGGHYLQLDRPDVVIEAIAEVRRQVSGGPSAVGAVQARPSH